MQIYKIMADKTKHSLRTKYRIQAKVFDEREGLHYNYFCVQIANEKDILLSED